MKILVVIIMLTVAAILAFQWWGPWLVEQPPVAQKLEEVASTKISKELAVENVKKIPEVAQYLKDVPNGKVEVDNELEGEYNVHVYEVKNGHTATFNWYTVSIKSGIPEPQFPVVSSEEAPKTDKGTVSGKLCYPSEVLPEGVIEAKRISDGKVFILNHGGSQDEAGTKYIFKLEAGDYYLRYNAGGNGKFIGYSTTVCPTGMQESCGDTKQREIVKAQVVAGWTVSGYDLCDYYYKDSNAPKF